MIPEEAAEQALKCFVCFSRFDRTLMITDSLSSCVLILFLQLITLQWDLINYLDGLGFGVSGVDIVEYSCNMEGAFLHFVLSFSIDQCRWLRSSSLVVFTVSAS